jgi:hypothetical protein
MFAFELGTDFSATNCDQPAAIDVLACDEPKFTMGYFCSDSLS